VVYFQKQSSNTPQTQEIIRLNHISKSFQGKPTLNNISFAVNAGEFVTLLGASGCGKTTVLHLISGLEETDSGEILINQRNVKGISPQARPVNTIFQNYALFPHLTVFDNVGFGLRCKGLPREEIQKMTLEALKMVKLDDLTDRMPNQLSGGQKQRVAIARAVVNKPKVLLLDESLNSLDYRLRKSMQLELKQLQKQLGIAFILVTHDPEEALSIADRVIIMDQGQIVQIGTPREVYEEPANLKVAQLIGETNIFKPTVLSMNTTHIQVIIEGNHLTLENRRPFGPDQPICVLVRPEDLKIWKQTASPDTKNVFSGIIEQVIYKGSTVDLMIKLNSQHLLAATQFFNEDDQELDFQLGELVWVSWIPGWEVILPYED